MAKLTRPKLKQGETPSSPSFQKRMAAFNRQEALAEATKAKAEQDAREAAERAKRDVLAEAADKPGQKPEKPAKEPEKPASKNGDKKTERVAESGRSALESRAATLREAIEGGVQEANDEAKRKRKRKK